MRVKNIMLNFLKPPEEEVLFFNEKNDIPKSVLPN